MNEPHDGIGHAEDGHLEPYVEPDIYFDEEGIDVSDFNRESVMAIAKFARRCFELGGIKSQRLFFQSVHAFCFAAQMHPMQDSSTEEIAAGLGITKAGFCKQVNRYRDILGLPRVGGAKSNQARKNYSKATKESHAKRNAGQSTSTFAGLLRQANLGARTEN